MTKWLILSKTQKEKFTWGQDSIWKATKTKDSGEEDGACSP